MNHEVLALRNIFDRAGIAWIESADLDRILSDIRAVEAEHADRYGLAPDLLGACRSNPVAMTSFLQSFALPMTTTMRTMIVQLLDGASVESVQYYYRRRQACSLVVQLSHPSRDFGEMDRFESASVWDVEVVRHFALMEVDGDPVLDGYYAFRPPSELPWEMDAREAVQRALEQTTWNPATQQATLPGPDQQKTLVFSDLRGLQLHLESLYRESWYAKVPFESGVAAFEPLPPNAVRQALQPYTDRITSLGWHL